MTLTLTLSPEREAWVEAQARAAGLSPEEYALRVLDRANATVPVLTPEEKAAQFLQWSREQNPRTPPLPVEATTREAIYADDAPRNAERAA